MTLCYHCASVIYDDESQTIHRADMNQVVKEKCFVCGHSGFDYEVKPVRLDYTQTKSGHHKKKVFE